MTAATGIDQENARGVSTMTAWESELAGFMNDLSSVQNDTLELLTKKRQCLATVDTEGLAALGGQEEELMNRLQECLGRRSFSRKPISTDYRPLVLATWRRRCLLERRVGWENK